MTHTDMGSTLYSWRDIAQYFEGADILLGNGFSLNISRRYNYKSLFRVFMNSCDKKEAHILRLFNSENFEFIQEEIIHAMRVNRLFNCDNNALERFRKKIREGLINAILHVNPRAVFLRRDCIFGMADILHGFGDIYTTNYDTHLESIISYIMSDDHYNIKFHDHFRDDGAGYASFHKDCACGCHSLYYLHGSLLLSLDKGVRGECKILKEREDLDIIDSIVRDIRGGGNLMYVCEGDSDSKRKAIAFSTYLSFAFSKFESCSDRLVIYGSSLSDNDNHIVEAINSRRRSIAISIYKSKKFGATVEQTIAAYKDKLICQEPGQSHDLSFFDSSTLFRNYA